MVLTVLTGTYLATQTSADFKCCGNKMRKVFENVARTQRNQAILIPCFQAQILTDEPNYVNKINIKWKS